ncbi:MAG: Bug family tripartite tricarboxylate transporter substrate binding protein [Candidatus Binatia bacterium]
MKKRVTIPVIAFSLSIFLAWGLCLTPTLKAQTDAFYKGKTIRIVVGYLSGDGYDIWARLFARHMGKHIPGNPDFIVQNMPGAGSRIAANYVYSVAKPDGLTLGAIGPSLYFDQLTGRKEVQFDWAKFTWIGTPEQTEFLLFIRSDTPYKTIEDIRKAADPPKCGATATGTSGHYMPLLLEETLGVKFNVILGYQGGGEIDVAVERGEVHCRNFTISTFFGREPFETWRKKGFVRVLIQTGKKRDERLPDIPTIYELMDQHKTPVASRRLATVILAPAVFGRPMVATAGIPPDRVKILRDAYNRSLNEPELIEETKKRGWVLEPIKGEDMQALAQEVMAQPPEVIERMKKLLGK